MVSVLLTRPQNTSAQLAKELQRKGYKTFIEPLLTISPTNTPRPITPVQSVMITSANALVALEENNADVPDLLNLPCFCIGSRTAGKARNFGFTNVKHSNGDGVDLAQLAGSTLKDKTILHISGKDTDSKAADQLRQSGFKVESWPIYKAAASNALAALIIERIKKHELDAVLVFSLRTAETLEKLIKQNGLETCCSSMIAIGLSDAVTARMQNLNWCKLIAASRPTEDAVIDCLEASLPAN